MYTVYFEVLSQFASKFMAYLSFCRAHLRCAVHNVATSLRCMCVRASVRPSVRPVLFRSRILYLWMFFVERDVVVTTAFRCTCIYVSSSVWKITSTFMNVFQNDLAKLFITLSLKSPCFFVYY